MPSIFHNPTNLHYLNELLLNKSFFISDPERQADYDGTTETKYHGMRKRFLENRLLLWRPNPERQARIYRGYYLTEYNTFTMRIGIGDSIDFDDDLWNPRAGRCGYAWGYDGDGPHCLASALICNALEEQPNEYDFYGDRSLASVANSDLVLHLLQHWTDGYHNHDKRPSLTGAMLDHWLVGWIQCNQEKVRAVAERQAYYLGAYQKFLTEKRLEPEEESAHE